MPKGETKSKARILVVEDDSSISDVVCSTLSGSGFVCTPAYSGTEAKLLIESGEPFDLAICDLMLPGMPGEDVVALIRSRGAAPILVTSAKAQVVDRVALLRMGADDYLVKPFDLDELVARVEALLRRAGSFPDGAGGADAAVEEKAISTHVSNVRAKLRPSGTEGYIETVWGIGFKLAELPA